ncbi:Major Facilitator Superfamily, partial [Teratosphaeria destructans]
PTAPTASPTARSSPLRFLTWPLILYTGFSYGSYLIWFNVLNGTTSIILSSPPYNFSTGIVGLTYLSCLLGVIAAAFYTGYFADWVVLRFARRGGKGRDVYEPEERLWGFALPTVVLPASLILWGVGAAHGVHWFGLMVAMFGIAFCNTCGISLSANYLVDSYRDISGEAMATMIFVRNTMSFAVGYGITPWLDDLGYQNCFISAAFVGLACCLVFLIMVWKGKALRERSRVEYWDLVRKHVEMGMVH